MPGERERIPAAAVVMTRNEAVNLPDCLATLGRFAELFVVDSGSRDGTPEIARRLGAVVVPFAWNGAYPRKKQWCLENLDARHDWLLFVDADERLTPALADAVAAALADPRRVAAHGAFHVESRPVVLGRTLRFGTRYSKIALMHRYRTTFAALDDLDAMGDWEVEGHIQPTVAGRIGRLRGHLLHQDRKPPSAWFDRHNRYSDWEAALDRNSGLACEPEMRRAAKRVFRALPARPLLVFLLDYVVRLGFLDGMSGLHHALGRAFYYWQIDYKRRWRRAITPRPRASQSFASSSPDSAFTSSNARRRTDSSGMR